MNKSDTLRIDGKLADTEFVIDGITYFFIGSVGVVFSWEDCGVDRREMGILDFEIDELEEGEIFAFDADDSLTEEEFDKIAPAMIDAMNSNGRFIDALAEEAYDRVW